jgi:hypothetical protein
MKKEMRSEVLPMDFRQMKYVLEDTIENLHRIVDQLSDQGDPLDRKDRQIVKSCLSTIWLPDILREAQFFVMSGNLEDANHSFQHIIKTFEMLE